MVTLYKAGVTNHDNVEGAIVQSTKIAAKVSEWTVLGMVNGTTEIVDTGTHSSMSEFTVEGRGDLTLDPGTDANTGLPLVGGIANILNFEYTQKLPDPSNWSYGGNHYPHAAHRA